MAIPENNHLFRREFGTKIPLYFVHMRFVILYTSRDELASTKINTGKQK